MQGFALQLNSTPKRLLSGASLLEAFWVTAAWWKTHFTPAAAMPTCKMHSSNLKGKCAHPAYDLSSRNPGLKFWASIDSCDHGTTIEVQWVWSSLGSQYSMIHTVSKMRPPLLFGLDAACMQPHRCANKYPKYAKYHATHWDSHLFVGEQQLQLLMPDFCGPASARFRGHCDDIVSLKIQCNHQSTKSSPNPSAQPPASKAGPNHLWYDDKPEVLAKLQRIQIRD